MFILAKDRNELKPYVKDVDKLKEDSMDWLDDNLDLSDMPKMIQKIVGEFTKLNNAAPTQTGADDGKKS